MAIPAHVDRKANGLLANLGWYKWLRGARNFAPYLATRARERFPQLRGYPLIQSAMCICWMGFWGAWNWKWKNRVSRDLQGDQRARRTEVIHNFRIIKSTFLHDIIELTVSQEKVNLRLFCEFHHNDGFFQKAGECVRSAKRSAHTPPLHSILRWYRII